MIYLVKKKIMKEQEEGDAEHNNQQQYEIENSFEREDINILLTTLLSAEGRR
jgi:hypothetical protein